MFNFLQKLNICHTCGTAFRAPEHGDPAFPFKNLCAEHRRAPMELAARKRAVAYWADANWERLEAVMKDQATQQAISVESLNQAFNRAISQQSNSAQSAYNLGAGLNMLNQMNGKGY